MIEAKVEGGRASIQISGETVEILVEAAILLRGILRSASEWDPMKKSILEALVAGAYKQLKTEDCTFIDIPIPDRGQRHEG